MPITASHQHWNGFLSAIGLLTILPVPASFFTREYDAKVQSLATLYYPVVGALIGAILFGVVWLSSSVFPVGVQAALVLFLWSLLTGGLHLDGLADSIDAFSAGHKDQSRILTIFKDPQSGPMAVAGLILVLLVKFTAIQALLQGKHFVFAIVFIPTVARLLASYYMASTAYVRKQGIASGINTEAYKVNFLIALSLCFCVWTIHFSFVHALVSILILSGVYYAWRQVWLTRIGGYTGDCVGGLIEIIEVITCLALVTVN